MIFFYICRIIMGNVYTLNQLKESGFICKNYKDLLRITHYLINPFPSYRRFLTPLQQMALWKLGDKRRNCSNEQFLLLSPCFQLYSIIVLSSKGFSVLLPRRFQSRLLQICCMLERVKCLKLLQFQTVGINILRAWTL